MVFDFFKNAILTHIFANKLIFFSLVLSMSGSITNSLRLFWPAQELHRAHSPLSFPLHTADHTHSLATFTSQRSSDDIVLVGLPNQDNHLVLLKTNWIIWQLVWCWCDLLKLNRGQAKGIHCWFQKEGRIFPLFFSTASRSRLSSPSNILVSFWTIDRTVNTTLRWFPRRFSQDFLWAEKLRSCNTSKNLFCVFYQRILSVWFNPELL